jgi:hypothetical protein
LAQEKIDENILIGCRSAPRRKKLPEGRNVIIKLIVLNIGFSGSLRGDCV